LYGRVAAQVVAQALGHRQHPLPHRQPRHDVIGEMGGGLHHAASIARGAHAAPLAGERDQEVVSTRLTEGTCKSRPRVSSQATFDSDRRPDARQSWMLAPLRCRWPDFGARSGWQQTHTPAENPNQSWLMGCGTERAYQALERFRSATAMFIVYSGLRV
jgi:hypothetical protein